MYGNRETSSKRVTFISDTTSPPSLLERTILHLPRNKAPKIIYGLKGRHAMNNLLFDIDIHKCLKMI